MSTDHLRDTRSVVIGVGNPYRADDGAGAAIIHALGAGPFAGPLTGVDLAIAIGEPSRVIEAWEGYDLAVVVDAMRSEIADPGDVARFELGADPMPPSLDATSSHATGVAEAVALAQALGRLPGRLVVFGVEGGDFGDGEGLSPPVASAIDRVVELVLAEVVGDVPA